MNISIKLTGIKEARKYYKNAANILAGIQGQFYSHQTAIIQQEIEKNADSSYDHSLAKTIALRSAEEWEHFTRIHRNRIMSTDYANIRQYCENTSKQAILVKFSEAGQKRMLEQAAEDLLEQ